MDTTLMEVTEDEINLARWLTNNARLIDSKTLGSVKKVLELEGKGKISLSGGEGPKTERK